MSWVAVASRTATEIEASGMEQPQSGDRIQPQLRLQQQQQPPPSSQDSLSSKIMLSSIAALFTAILVVLFFHLYIRWHLLRRRRLELLLSAADRRSPTLFPAPRGLDPDLLLSLPVAIRSASDDPIKCAVCLSEVEEGEKARNLPKCGHGFHEECIDMWFFNHSTCPLCRSAVEAPSPAPAVCNGCGSSSSSSSSSGGELVGLEEPPRRMDEEGPSLGFGSPLERVVSLKSLASRDRRSLYSGRVSDAEADLEMGVEAGPRPPSSCSPAQSQALAV